MYKHPLNGWALIICNPVSGAGRGLERLAAVKRALASNEVRFTDEVTQGRGDAARLARCAVQEGCSAVIVIGGDGTLFEVVNGIVDPAEPDSPHLNKARVPVGLIPSGRGSDFGRSVGVPSDLSASIARLIEGRTTTVDLGYVSYRSFAGKPQGRYFANAAGLGFDAEVAVRANKGPRVLGGTVTYLGSLLATLGTYRNKRVQVRADGSDEWHARVNSIVVANGQYFGGGMKIAPNAQLMDGELDVVTLGDLGKLDLVRNVPRVYDGSHITHPKVSTFRARHIEVQSANRMLLQADGEVLGTAPATFTVVPSALILIV